MHWGFSYAECLSRWKVILRSLGDFRGFEPSERCAISAEKAAGLRPSAKEASAGSRQEVDDRRKNPLGRAEKPQCLCTGVFLMQNAFPDGKSFCVVLGIFEDSNRVSAARLAQKRPQDCGRQRKRRPQGVDRKSTTEGRILLGVL